MLQADIPLLLPQAYTLYLARHATPDRSRFDIPYHFPPGPDLTEKGRREAQELGAFLRQVGIVHILASPLERAWRTAVIAAEAAAAETAISVSSATAESLAEVVSPTAEPALVEVISPTFSAAPSVEVNIDLAEHRPNESEKQVLERVLRAFDLSARLSAERGKVALVSHGSPVLILLKHLGLPAEIIEHSRIYDGRNLIPPAGVWEICRSAGQVSLRLVFVPNGVRRPAVDEAWVGA